MWNFTVSLTAGESMVNNFGQRKKKTNTFVFFTKFCIAEILKSDFFSIAIVEM